ncbi:MAG TPA: APC family permease [Steroidobacter sp.]|jgi:amino acid transporter
MTQSQSLTGQLTPGQFFTMAVGAMIGAAWIPLLGIWLGDAGSIGAALAFLSATVLISLIGLAYIRVAAHVPISGAEVSYALHFFGRAAAFLTGWILCFIYIAVASFEAISIGWILSTLVPSIEGPVVYRVLGADVKAGSLALALGGTVVLCWLNARGATSAARTQHVLTLALFVASALFIAAGLLFGDFENLAPWFAERESGWRWGGVLALFVLTPLFFGGFNFAVQALGERAPGVTAQDIGRVLVLAILVTGLFYALVIIAAAMSLPRAALLAQPLPAAAAFRVAFDSVALGNVVLIAGLLGLVTTWNAVIFAAIRILHRLASAGLLMPAFANLHPKTGAPTVAIIFTGVVSAAGALLGLGALVPIVNAAGVGITAAYVVVCLAAWKLHRDTLATVTVLIAAFVLLAACAEPFIATPTVHVPTQWKVLIAWFASGIIVYTARRRVEAPESAGAAS